MKCLNQLCSVVGFVEAERDKTLYTYLLAPAGTLSSTCSTVGAICVDLFFSLMILWPVRFTRYTLPLPASFSVIPVLFF